MKISYTIFNLQSEHEYMVEMDMFNVQRAITPRVGKPELRFCTSSHDALHLCEVLWKYLEWYQLWGGHMVHVEMAMFKR